MAELLTFCWKSRFLILKSAKKIFNCKECLFIGSCTKMDLYSQPTWPSTLKPDIKQSLFIGLQGKG